MDSGNLFGYDLPVGDISFAFSSTTSQTDWTFGATKITFGNSPDSPLSASFDCENISASSNSQEYYSSSDNLSNITPYFSSSLELDRVHALPSNISDNSRLPLRSNTSPCGGDACCSSRVLHALQEIEAVLMSPDVDDVEKVINPPNNQSRQTEPSKRPRESYKAQTCSPSQDVNRPKPGTNKYRRSDQAPSPSKQRSQPEIYFQEPLKEEEDVKQLLLECAKALSDDRESDFQSLIEKARKAVCVNGDPVQRLGAYMVEGLVARKEASGSNIYRSLRCNEPDSKDLLTYMHILYEICPYVKFGYMAANGAIAEAFKNEDRVHIIDFQIAQGTQWITLLQALAARPNGPPHVRITGIDDPVSKHARGQSIDAIGKRLAAISEKFKIPVEFQGLPAFAFSPDITPEMLNILPGEALAVNFTLGLHHTPDESVDVNNPRDGLLRMVKALNPKVMTLVEQESNTNTTPFFMRFKEALDFYSAMFDSIDMTLPRDNKDRINVEEHCLARDIVNVIACEGKERVERHELLGKWRSRLMMAGFKPYPLSAYVNTVIRSLLRTYSENYTLVEKDEALLLGWKNRNLISASAWH